MSNASHGAGGPENPSPPFREERVAGAQRRTGEVGVGERSGIPHLTPALSAPGGGEGEIVAQDRRNLVGMGRAELAAEMASFGAEPFRGSQLWHWVYHR